MNQLSGHKSWADIDAWSTGAASGMAGRTVGAAMLRDSGLFDGIWHCQTYPDIAASDIDPAEHFYAYGWREGRRPNPYFDTDWYLRRNPDVAEAGINPLLHYILAGEAEGRAPAAHFDLAWYATQHQADPGQTLLAHFLRQRCAGGVSPLPEFDAGFYLSRYSDVAAAGVDPFEHYLLYGYREGRDPSADFDTRFYLHRYLDGETGQNPLMHYRETRHLLRLHTRPPTADYGVFEELRKFTRPGPDFEDVQPLPSTAHHRAKVLAYYLPQFHAIRENDAWWGKGFTEWTATGRGMPRFVGQYQPRIPRDLGHYTLGTSADDTAVMRAQIGMARDAGLFGFVQYFYWFNGRRLLEGPLEAFLADATLDFPFCLMWANENWTRRWDGSDDEVLISQDYDPADDAALVDCLARHFRDARYIRLEGRPLLMIYRARTIPDTKATIARWRELFRIRHGEDPVMVMSQSFDALDPRDWGFDGAIEFPPHKLTAGLRQCRAELTVLDPGATAQVFAYDDVVAASLGEQPPAFPLIKTAVPSWDNDARRQGAGLVLHGSTPAKYQAWMEALIERAQHHPFMGERFVCVNAWNEWAEGAYLEPDMYYGGAYLNATSRAVTRMAPDDATAKLLLVGHDAFPAGAQQLLLNLARQLQQGLGVQVEYLLLGDGKLATEYAAVAPGMVVADPARLDALIAGWAARGFTAAIVNSSAAAWVAPKLEAAGIEATLMVHEMPRLIREKGLLAGLRAGVAAAGRIVFPAVAVRESFAELVAFDPARARIMPQGAYRMVPFSAKARARKRAELELPKNARLVLGAGYADLRKGFDLFLQAWRAARRSGRKMMFCWIGDIDPVLHTYLGDEIAAAETTGTFRYAGFQQEVADWFSAADVFALTSREDPFPSVVLEALGAGLPTIAFAGSGGIPAVLCEHHCGDVVAMADVDALATRLLAADARGFGGRERLASLARAHFAFERYAEAMLREVRPGLVSISAVVPSYNYARYLEARLSSIFAQTYPLAEVIVLDDASTDDSIDVANRVATHWNREVAVVVNPVNSGSVFAQWRRAAELARGDFVWIAEADDAADPGFLAAVATLLRGKPDIDLAFTDSRSIDSQGRPIWPDYQDYYLQSGASALSNDGVYPAADFARRFLVERNLILNVSGVVWRRTALRAALERCGEELEEYQLAGDWRLYVELMAASVGHVGYIAAPLNVHRRHDSSVTYAVQGDRHLGEIARMHKVIKQRLDPDEAMLGRQAAYQQTVSRLLKLETAAHDLAAPRSGKGHLTAAIDESQHVASAMAVRRSRRRVLRG
jgi:glycosyltransferase involved in cell wall biosynthesis